MAKQKDNRNPITLACNDCKERNYTTSKNRKNQTERLGLNKFCPRCRKHTGHRETR